MRLSNTHLVTYAVYLLNGGTRFVDTEDVAMKVHELSPGRFSWRKHPEQINLELVRVRLSEAKSPSHGALLRGSQRRGWTLTAAGLAWAKETAAGPDSSALAGPEHRERGGSVDTQRLDREKTRLTSSSAWRKWPDSVDEISRSDAEEVFRVDSYANAELREIKTDRLRKMFADDVELLKFLEHLQSRLVD